MSSLNVLLPKKGSKGYKVWRFIHPQDAGKVSNKMETDMRRRRKKFASCEARVVHKPGLWIPTEVLTELEVRYCYVVQRPGDVVYVGPEVPHCVLNLDYNVAHAILWTHKSLFALTRFLECNCFGEIDLRLVCLNTRPLHRCRFFVKGVRCGKVFKSDSDLDAHRAIAHLITEGTYICQWPGCNKKFRLNSQRTLHELVHSDKTFTCSICEKSIKFSNKANHTGRCRKRKRLLSDATCK